MTIHIDEHSAHATYAPSSAHRWTVCTASAEAIARLPEQEEGEAAAKGTAAHDEIERCLSPLCESNMDKDPAPYPLSEAVNADHESAYGVALVIDYVRQLPPGKLWIEQRVALTEQIWGRCDVSHWDGRETVTIVDYKDGFVDVAVEENEQLRTYGAAVITTHKLPAKWVRYVIVQPNSLVPGPRVKQWVEPVSALMAWAEKTAAIPAGPKEFVAGEQCKYCPLFGRCPASQDLLRQFNAVLINTPDQVPAALRAKFMACKKPVEDWFKSAEKAWTKDALTSAPPEGMKLVTSTTKRAWKDEAAARKAVLDRFGVDALDPPTPAQAEKLGLDVSELSAAPEGGPVLAFESDKRKPWAAKSAAEMFKDVPR